MAIRILIIILLFSLTGCNYPMGADLTLDEKIDNEIISLDKDKIEYVKLYIKDDVRYEKHEYKNSKGEVGTQIFVETDEFYESIGTGVEAKSRTFKIYKNKVTATSTK